jgi:predicted Zn finger-like uncharacterized protein
MDIVCRHCNASYTIADHKLPPQKAKAQCKRCDQPIVIDPPAATASSAVAAAAPEGPPTAATPPPGRDLAQVFPQIEDYPCRHYALSEVLQPNRKGHYGTRLNKLKLKILAAVKPTLDQMLEKDERVMRIAAGSAYFPIEIFLGNGFFTMLYNRYAVVATNQRLLMINTDHRLTKPSHYLFQLKYDAIRKVARGLFRTNLSLTLKNGRRRLFTAMPMALTAEMQAYIEPQLVPGQTTPSGMAVRDHLCPACFAGLPAKLSRCTACQASFKTVPKATLRSLLLPGWGHMYLGHRILGGLELVGALCLWSLALNMLFFGGSANIAAALMILVFYHGLDALLTGFMARKGYMLASRQTAVHTPSRMAPEPA